MAWYRTDLYHRVLTTSGTFVNQQWPFNPETPDGAWGFHNKLIPESPKKPLRIYLAVGDRDLLNPNVMRDDMHDWVEANHRMAKVLKERYPRCTVILGGLQASPDTTHRRLYTQIMTECAAIDYAFCGHVSADTILMLRNIWEGAPEKNRSFNSRILYRDEQGAPQVATDAPPGSFYLPADLQSLSGLKKGLAVHTKSGAAAMASGDVVAPGALVRRDDVEGRRHVPAPDGSLAGRVIVDAAVPKVAVLLPDLSSPDGSSPVSLAAVAAAQPPLAPDPATTTPSPSPATTPTPSAPPSEPQDHWPAPVPAPAHRPDRPPAPSDPKAHCPEW